jgi:hypothetical protein
MIQTKSVYFVLLIACTVSLAGCEKKASDEIGFGTFHDSVYSNKYFGLTLTLPPEWSIQNQKSQQQLMDVGEKTLAGENKNLKAVFKASQLKTVNLLAAFKHPIGTPVPFNPSIMCVAERIRHAPGIKRGKDYLFHSRKILESSQLSTSFPRDISTEELGGASFDVMYCEMELFGMTIRQKHYATVAKGYALGFIVSFTTEEEEASLQSILETVAFD